MKRVRGYWLDFTIVTLAITAFAMGILHRPVHPASLAVSAAHSGGLAPHEFSNRLDGNTAFSVDVVSSDHSSKTFGGTGTAAFSTRKGDEVTVTGWAVDSVAQAPASAVMLQVGPGERIVAQYGASRPDVARVLGVPTYVNSGFVALIPTTKLRVGRHDLSLLIFDAKTRGYYLEKNRVLLSLRSH